MKKVMAQFTQTTELKNGRYSNHHQIKSWSDDLSGVRPGKNIEDVERSALDHLFGGERQTASYNYDLWKSPMHNMRDYLESKHPKTTVSPKEVIKATTTVEAEENYIDPITNRRASKKSLKAAESSPKYKDLDQYGVVQDQNVDKNEKEQYNDLDKYVPADDAAVDQQDQAKKYDDLDKYGPVTWHEPDGLREETPEEGSKDYPDLHKYSATKFDNPLAPRQLTSEEQSKKYNDLHLYQSVQWNEPDGLRVQTSEELSKNYDDLHQYNAVHWNEPDGLRKLTPEELSKNYTDLGEYDGPVAWCEPHGLRRLTPEELSKNYTDLDAYAMPFTAPDSVLQAHEAAQQDRTVKGKTLAKKVDVPAENLAEKYEDLDKYGPVHWNEPNGLRMMTPEELSKQYDDLHLYGGGYQWNEPDGLRSLTPEEQSKRYRDVSQYVSRELAGESKWINPEEASKNYKDLPKYREYDNGDPAAPWVHPEESSKQYKDLSNYAQYSKATPEAEIIHPDDASKQYNDFHMHPEETTKSYQDLGTYKPILFDSPLESYLLRPEEIAACKNLYNYNGGKPTILPDPVVYGSLKEFNTKACSPFPDIGPFTYQGKANRLPPSSPESNVDDVDTLTAEEIRAATLRRAGVLDEDAHSEVRDSEVKLTGNYARDFPEEFSTSWSVDNSPSKSTLFPKSEGKDEEASVVEKNVDAELSSTEQSVPIQGGRLQPALDRQLESKEKEDAYSHLPQGLETSFSEECDRKETLPIMEHHFTPTPTPAREPELYKILAYDSASQNITVAEATSTIHNETTPSSLADVLIRLSNPSKFLPHFKSLEDQGYEIVSGSGDVLIFRKVRPGTIEESLPEPEPTTRARPINPIDLMGHPAVGNFASPTGFVSYDALDEAQDKPAPPFRSRVYSHREPSVGGGAKASQERKKGSSIGRKVVLGTVWLAGSACAVGVMAEYFNARGFEAEARPRRL